MASARASRSSLISPTPLRPQVAWCPPVRQPLPCDHWASRCKSSNRGDLGCGAASRNSGARPPPQPWTPFAVPCADEHGRYSPAPQPAKPSSPVIRLAGICRSGYQGWASNDSTRRKAAARLHRGRTNSGRRIDPAHRSSQAGGAQRRMPSRRGLRRRPHPEPVRLGLRRERWTAGHAQVPLRRIAGAVGARRD